MRTLRVMLVLGIVLGTVAAGVAMAGDDNQRRKGKTKVASATLVNGRGDRVGRVTLVQFRGRITVTGTVKGVTPGFHGFHVHAVGKCEGPAFTTAGGHFTTRNTTHGAHAGDLPPLLVNANGTASAAFETDRFTLAQLRDRDGSALIVHAGPDNFANIPTRYAPAPDQETLNTGDSGPRVACGVVK